MIHILVVDDDKNLNQTVCTYLNDCGFEAKGVLSANEAYDEMYNQSLRADHFRHYDAGDRRI